MLSNRSLILVIFLLPSLITFGGCSNTDSPDGKEKKDKPKTSLQNLRLHRPKTFQLAVNRLREMHETINSETGSIQNTKLKIVEIVHGEGTASEHSHFYLEEAFKSGKRPDDLHEGESESQKNHEIEIPFAKEFKDIARWLPNLAASTELGEDAWTKVQKLSDELGESLSDAFNDPSKTAEAMREAYRKTAKATESSIGSLEKLVSELGEK